jgi:hypothetical protein
MSSLKDDLSGNAVRRGKVTYKQNPNLLNRANNVLWCRVESKKLDVRDMHGNGEEEAAPGGRARSNAARVAILGLLGQDGCELSAPQIHLELCGEMTLRSVRYHLRVLEACELIAEENGRYKLV